MVQSNIPHAHHSDLAAHKRSTVCRIKLTAPETTTETEEEVVEDEEVHPNAAAYVAAITAFPAATCTQLPETKLQREHSRRLSSVRLQRLASGGGGS